MSTPPRAARLAFAAAAVSLAGTACRAGGGAGAFERASVIERLRATYPEVSLPPDALPAGVVASEGLVYARVNDRALALDVYRPATGGPHPAVVIVHGGGWESGDREMERPFAKRLAAYGFVAAPIDYRLRAEGRFPAAFVDVRAAVRWLRAHAAALGVDGARIGAVGGSAGGHLVALLGATNGARVEGDEAVVGAVSADVQAVVALDGLADFTGPALLEKEARNPGGPTHFLGGGFAARGDVWRAASPLFHIGPKSAPTLFLDSSAATPILPGRPEMCARLIAAGVLCIHVVTPGTPHPFWLVNPWFEPTVERTARFLQRILDAPASPAAP